MTKEFINSIVEQLKEYVDAKLRGWGLSDEEKSLVAFEQKHMPYTQYSGNQSIDHVLFRKFLRLFDPENIRNNLANHKQDKYDEGLKTSDKTVVGAINEVRSQAMSSHLTIHGGEVVQNYSQGDEPQFTTIVKDLPAGRYTISCNLISATGTYPNSQNYGYSSIVMYNSDGNVIGKANVYPQGNDIVVSEVATLKICPVRSTAFNIQNGELVPNVNLAIDIPEKYTFKNIWVLPAHECNLGTVGSRLDALEKLPAKTADVSLFATTQQGRGYDDVYVKAPAGMLKETDQVIFARYITNKTRPRVNGQTDQSTPRSVYRGWIQPACGGRNSYALFVPDDKLKLIYQTTIDGYDHFYLDVDPDGDDEPLLFYLWEYARIDKDGHRHPRIKDKKLGIKIVRDGNTVVDYLPFTVEVDLNDHIHFGRL